MKETFSSIVSCRLSGGVDDVIVFTNEEVSDGIKGWINGVCKNCAHPEELGLITSVDWKTLLDGKRLEVLVKELSVISRNESGYAVVSCSLMDLLPRLMSEHFNDNS